MLYRNKMQLPDSFGISGEYDIVSCGICGCCYANVTASEEDYDNYYRNNNIYGGWQANSSSSYDVDVLIRSIGELVDKDAKIIDIGFGNGKLLGQLKKSGFNNLLGIDPSQKAVEELEGKGIAGKVGAIYEGLVDQFKKADVVIFTMVLEHLLFPGKAVKAILDNFLKENGYLIVTWPYFDDLIADGSPIANNFNHEHINYFSKQTAEVLFERFGLFSKAHHVSLGMCRGRALQFSNIAVYNRSKILSSSHIVKDEKTVESLREYVKRADNDEQKLLDVIEEKVYKTGKKIVVWGVGAYLYHLMRVSFLPQCNIAFMVDGNPAKQGSKIFGYKIKEPKALQEFEGIVLVTAMLYGEEIKKEIEAMGNDNLEIVLGV